MSTHWPTSVHFALSLLTISSLVVLGSALTCPNGQQQYGNRCIKTYRPASTCNVDFSFNNANNFCQSNGGQLVSVHSQAQEDQITALIKRDQKKHAPTCGCQTLSQDYNYWIGLQLTHAPNGSVNGASWTDSTPVDYGNPLNPPFRPPFVSGTPVGSQDDGGDDSAVCPGGNMNNCVQIFGYGDGVGLWTDRNCSNTHPIVHSCSCNETNHTSSQQTSPSNVEPEDVVVDQCRDEAALNGFICEYCPQGWVGFQGSCYITLGVAETPDQYEAACAALGAKVVSIHSVAENQFVAGLAAAQVPASQINYIGLRMTHTSLLSYAPVNSVAWTDGSTVDFGNAMVAPWTTPGNYPWAPATPPPGFQAQPDNQPPPANCVLMWLPASPAMGNHPGTWDDLTCTSTFGSTTCKI